MDILLAEPCETADAVLSAARELSDLARHAEAMLLVRAAEWADLHPVLPGEPPAMRDAHLPGVAWEAPAEFGLAIGLSDDAGRDLIHEALELRHRLPSVWRRLREGEVLAWRARRIAQTTIGQPADVVASLDRTLGPIAHKVGPITLARLLDEAMMRLHAVERELAQIQALDHRHVRVFDQISHNGVATIEIRADIKDAFDFDDAVARIAQRLADEGCAESLDVRRSLAVGVLADPEGAAALLAGGVRRGRPRKEVQLFVHLTDTALWGLQPVARCELANQPVLEQQVREWCGRTDTHVTVTGVIDLAEHHHVEAYEVPDRLALRSELIHGTCVFPHCRRRARRCDSDHRIPHAEGGPTCLCNLAPLCRRHHRLKTLRGWRYDKLGPATYRWKSPHGLQFQRDPTGTVRIRAEAGENSPRAPAHVA